MNTKTKNLLKIVSFIFIGYIGLSEIPDLISKFDSNSLENRRKRMPIENWQETAPGRFAHSLQYEDKLPKPVPYKFYQKTMFNTWLTSKEKKLESNDYFEHLCNTEAGNYVWETVGNVDHIAYLRLPTIPLQALNTYQDRINLEKKEKELAKELNGNYELVKEKLKPFKKELFTEEEYLMHRDALEAPMYFDLSVAATLDSELEKKPEIIGLDRALTSVIESGNTYYKINFRHYSPFYIDPFTNIDFWYNNGTITSYKERDFKYPHTHLASQQTYIQARYGVTWRGFTREKDRELGIAGGDLIIVDLQNNNKVIAVQRNFVKASVNFSKNLYSWRGAIFCPESYKYSTKSFDHAFNEKTPFEQKEFTIRQILNYFIPQALTLYVLKHDSVGKEKIAVSPNIIIKH